jgi:hypothetical protein
MNKTIRNFWIDIILFLLLGVDIALVAFTGRESAGTHPGFGWHLHTVISVLLTFGSLLHIALHWQWFQAVLSGKAKGRMKLIMNSLVVIAMLLAGLSGHEVLASNTAGRLHSLTGYFALIGMSVHAIKHTRWMAVMTKRLIVDDGQEKVVQSA